MLLGSCEVQKGGVGYVRYGAWECLGEGLTEYVLSLDQKYGYVRQ
jgi:hypothetical protein